MIHQLATTIYNGDALGRLRVRSAEFPMHEYYTIGVRGSLEIADLIREYNVVRVTESDGLILASGNAQEWRWLDQLLRTNVDDKGVILADNIKAALPKVFKDIPPTRALARR